MAETPLSGILWFPAAAVVVARFTISPAKTAGRVEEEAQEVPMEAKATMAREASPVAILI
jgi:hypothetical protein